MNARMGMKMKTDLIQGAIFDMDGTLLDSMPVWEHASERYLQNKGIKVREKLSEILFSMSMQKGAEYVKVNYHLTESTDEIVAGVNNIVYTAYEKEVQPKEGVREFLDKLQAEGIKMVVATSTDRPMVEAALKRTAVDRQASVFPCKFLHNRTSACSAALYDRNCIRKIRRNRHCR